MTQKRRITPNSVFPQEKPQNYFRIHKQQMSLYNQGDQVFAKHESHSWILAKVTKVSAIKDVKLQPGRKSKSSWIYDCVAADPQRGAERGL